MPWWVIPYLCVLALVSAAGCWNNYRSAIQWWLQVLGMASALFSVLFVFAYFDQTVGDSLGYIIFPMLLTAIGWDLYEMNRDLSSLRRESEVSLKEQKTIEYMVVVIVGFVVIPAYLAGMAVAYRLFVV